MIILAYILLFISIYPYFIYPVLLFILTKVKTVKYKFSDSLQPDITIVISVYNEEELIVDCLKSIRQVCYPQEKITVIIGSDGATDNTSAVIQEYLSTEKITNVFYYEFPRSGKNLVLNQILPKVKTEYVFYMDADIRLTQNAISNSVGYLVDEAVGIVISRMKQVNFYEFSFSLLKQENQDNDTVNGNLSSNAGALGESLYQKYEHYLRLWSSQFASSVNSLGAFYVMKMSLYEPIPNGKVCDDYFTVLNCLTNNKKVMYNPDSVVIEVRKKQMNNEMARRIRLTAGSLSTIQAKPQVFSIFGGKTSFLSWSNKLLRLSSPLWFILAAIIVYLTPIDMGYTLYFRVFFETILLLFVFSSIVDILSVKAGIELKIFKVYRYFILMNIGYLLGFFVFLRGRHNSTWEHKV